MADTFSASTMHKDQWNIHVPARPSALLTQWVQVVCVLLLLCGGAVWIAVSRILPVVLPAFKEGLDGNSDPRSAFVIAGLVLYLMFLCAGLCAVAYHAMFDPLGLPIFRVSLSGRRVRWQMLRGMPWEEKVFDFCVVEDPKGPGPIVKINTRVRGRSILLLLDEKHFLPQDVLRAAAYLQQTDPDGDPPAAAR